MFSTIFVLFGLVAGSNEPYAMFAMDTKEDCQTVADIFNKTAYDETFFCEERS